MGVAPHGDFSTDNDARESDAVFETGAIVGGLGVYAHDDQHENTDEDAVPGRAGRDPAVVVVCEEDLEDGEEEAAYARDNDVKEAMHAAVETAESNGQGVDVAEELKGKFGHGGHCGVLMKRIEGPYGNGHSVRSVG